MKVEPRRVEAFLREPGQTRLVLLYGADVGQVRERASALTKLVAGTLDDPFRVAELARDRTGELADSMGAMSLTGGRCVVRVREAGDAMTEAAKRALASRGDALAILEAGELPGRSKLRVLLEAAPDAAVIACHAPDARGRADAVRMLLGECGIGADADAMAWLADHLGGDRALMRGEIEKLAVAIGGKGVADLPAVQASVGDLAGLSLDDALFSATVGDVPATDRALDLAMAEGAAPVQLIRAAMMHLQKLHVASMGVARGASAADAAKGLRPPVFYQRLPAFIAALSRWPETSLQRSLALLAEAERGCKRTGSPAEIIARNAIVGIALRGAALRRGR